MHVELEWLCASLVLEPKEHIQIELSLYISVNGSVKQEPCESYGTLGEGLEMAKMLGI